MSPLATFLRAIEPKDNIPILMYHGFTDQKTFNGIENYHGKHLHIDKFKEQLRYLKDRYHLMPLPDLVACLAARKPVPSRSAVITIDDGYRSNFTLAYPALKEFAVPATVFLTTNFITKRNFLWTDRLEYALNTTHEYRLQIIIGGEGCFYGLTDAGSRQRADTDIKMKLKEISTRQRDSIIEDIEDKLGQKLSFGQDVPAMYAPLERPDITEMAAGRLVSFGSHTCSHVIITACTQEEMRGELLGSKERVEEMTGQPCTFFSYPNGGAGDFNDVSESILKDLGYQCALTTIIGSNNASSDLFKLKRLNIHNDGDMGGFVRTLSVLGRFLRRVKNAGLAAEAY